MVAPSQVWPFRKIFLPSWRDITRFIGIDWRIEEAVEAIELEMFHHKLPDLIFNPSPFYRYIKERRTIEEVRARELRDSFAKFMEGEAGGGDDVDRFLQKPLREVARETARDIKSGNWLLSDQSGKRSS